MPLKMHAYGNGYDSARSNNIEYMGSFPAERLPVVLNEKFGLIWMELLPINVKVVTDDICDITIPIRHLYILYQDFL